MLPLYRDPDTSKILQHILQIVFNACQTAANKAEYEVNACSTMLMQWIADANHRNASNGENWVLRSPNQPRKRCSSGLLNFVCVVDCYELTKVIQESHPSRSQISIVWKMGWLTQKKHSFLIHPRDLFSPCFWCRWHHHGDLVTLRWKSLINSDSGMIWMQPT